MKDTNLISSAAVFRALYDEKKDLYDVLSEFIRAVISYKSLSSFDSIQCIGYLDKEFGFKIPEAIIKSCLKKRLVKNGELEIRSGQYVVTSTFEFKKDIERDFENSQSEYDEIVNRLTEHCGSKSGTVDKEEVKSDFEDYLVRPDKSNKYTRDIANFIVLHEKESGFNEIIEKVEEGLILYNGIRYSPDLSTLGQWRNDLIVYLDAEHLFSATGFNGSLYQQLFKDFRQLVTEANSKKRGGKISLRFLEETRDEVDKFFYAAENIVDRAGTIDPSKTAMINICNGCGSRGDVKQKKAEFHKSLKDLNIRSDDRLDYYTEPELNLESKDGLQRIHEEIGENHVTEEEISLILKIFTKINVRRSGISNVGIDGVSAIFVTESWLPQRMAFSENVFEGNGSIPFATNIEFMTEKLWFKLNKGFGKSNGKPASFDPIIRAKLIISSQVGSSVSKIYKTLIEDLKSGKYDKETIAHIHHEIYKAPSSPEDVSIDSISISNDLFEDNYLEKVIKEKSILEKDAQEGRMAVAKLRKVIHEKKLEQRKPFKRAVGIKYCLLKSIIYVLIPIIILALIIVLKTSNDSILSLIFGLLSIVGFLITFINSGKINQYIKRKLKVKYANKIKAKK